MTNDHLAICPLGIDGVIRPELHPSVPARALTGPPALDLTPPAASAVVHSGALVALKRSTSTAQADTADRLPLAAWLRPALDLPLIEISIDATIRRDVRLSALACAVVRGRLGKRLREVRCLTGARTCDGCAASSRCDFAQLFDDGAPHAFWLQGVPATAGLDRGARLSARLYLAGPAHAAAPYFDVTFRDALRALDPDAVLSPSRWRRMPLGALAPPALPAGPLRLRTETPLCLRGDEARCRSLCPRAPWLALLVRAGVRRLDALVRAFAPPPSARLPRADLPDLSTIALIGGALAPWASRRFSHRQQQVTPLVGLHGDAVLHGDHLDAIAPLLRALTVTSVGKATSLGLGTLRLTAS